MIWLTWRQFRIQAVAAAAVLAAFAIALAATGPHLASLYATSKITGCHGSGCATAASTFLSRLDVTSPYPVLYEVGLGLILVAPGIMGIFWGAPLIARELENRTFALAWNQSVTRTRWLAVKLALTGLAAMAVTEALSLIYAWWADPISKAAGTLAHLPASLQGTVVSVPLFGQGELSSLIFASHGITPLGYAAFAFALGTAAGALIRRSVPAMAVTLVVFAAVQVVMPLAVRSHLTGSDRMTASIPAARINFGNLGATVVPGNPDAWILSSGVINAAGQHVSTAPAACLGPPPPVGTAAAKVSAPDPSQCMASRGYREAITYLPVSRYWPLQWIETGIFLALALALAAFCFWRLSRRRT